MKKKWIIAGVIVLVLAFIGFNIWNSNVTTTVAVKTASLEDETMKESVMAPGVLKLKNEQYVYYQADKGEIDEFHVKAGDTVEKGDKLLTYENKQLELDEKENQLQINAAYNDQEKARKDLEKINKELDKDPDNEMLEDEQDQIKEQQQQAENDVDQALLQKESLENEIAALDVKADVAGSVLDVDKKAGAQGQLGEESIIRIGSLDDLFVEGKVSEHDTMNIETEQNVELTSDAAPDKSWTGEISYIGDLPEEEGQEMGQEDANVDYPIEVALDDDIELKPGFTMLIEVITSDKKASTLPINSVIQKDDDNYVFIVKDGKAKRVKVQVGAVDTEKMEIEEGVSAKDQIITNPPDDLNDGMEVTTE